LGEAMLELALWSLR